MVLMGPLARLVLPVPFLIDGLEHGSLQGIFTRMILRLTLEEAGFHCLGTALSQQSVRIVVLVPAFILGRIGKWLLLEALQDQLVFLDRSELTVMSGL